MLIEIHALQNHAPGNLNRDDTGSPKECTFGGVRRARISSQCLKRTIRRSEIFQTTLEGKLGRRTRQLPEIVKDAFEADETLKLMAEIAAKKTTGFGTKEGKEREQDAKSGKWLTAQTIFLTPADERAVIDVMIAAAQEAKTVKVFDALKAADLQKQAQSKGFRPITVDVALFGRMTTSEALRDVEASCQVAHALSTHKVDHEYDYYTAVDDLMSKDGETEEDAGADMIGDVEFNSACYYKYLSLDVDGLTDNLVAHVEKKDREAAKGEARKTAADAVEALLRAGALVTPSGKQNSFASHTLPAAIFVEIRPVRTPVSYANAFVEPVRPFSKADSRDLVSASLECLAEHAELLTGAFNLPTTKRFAFAPLHPNLKMPGMTRVSSLDELIAGIREAMGNG